MTISAVLQSGQHPAVYLNDGAFQEYVFQVSSGVAETQTGGVRINMIPREGGNQFSGQFITLFSNTDLQGQNVTDKLRARGLTTPAALYRLYDVNGSLGGPIVRNRLWFFTSTRVWAYNNFVANAFNPDGSQAQDDNLLEGYTNRLTWQMSQKNKLTAVLDRLPKYRGHRNLEVGGVDPKATVVQSTPLSYYAQAKWTSTLTNKLLLEAGYSTNFYGFSLQYRPEVTTPSASNPFGDIAKRDIILGTLRNAAESALRWPMYKYHISSAVSYVTGSHALKTGVQWTWGYERQLFTVNGDLVQRYANGVPHSVLVRNTPTFQRQDLKTDLGLYVQDTWTIDRLTLNPGLRFEYFNGEVPEQTAPAGRFVPARRFDRIPNLPDWKNVAPRFGAAYDLFGNGKTAVKGSIGKYMQQESVGYPNTYNPMVLSSDIRTWRDLNGDDIAQEHELGPTTNLAFGVRRNRNPDPEIERPYQLLYNLGIQHELRTGLGVSVSYYRRGFYNITWTDNLDTTHADYTLVTVPDPRGNGQTLPVYNLNRSKLGLVNELDTHSTDNTETFNGVDVTFNARFPNGATMFGGTSTGRTRRVTCQVDDPNQLRFCDETKSDIPFLTTFKLSGSYPLPYEFRLSGVFQSVPGEEVSGRATGRIHYVVDRRIIPTLTLAQVIVPLIEPGGEYYDRVNQLDISVSRIFRLGRVQVNPQLDLFNALNVSPLLLQVNAFGPALRQARRILDARVLRLGVQVNF